MKFLQHKYDGAVVSLWKESVQSEERKWRIQISIDTEEEQLKPVREESWLLITMKNEKI